MLEAGQTGAAIVKFQEALRASPENVDVLNEAALREAVRLNSTDAEAHNALGIVLAKRGQLDGAKEHLRAAARLKPSNTVFSENLGCAERQLQGCALGF
jgi:tetratricopeptide (TPR) repeat protein